MDTSTGHHDLSRYHRQMLLPGFGVAGQERLLAGHAVIVGCGALGCSSADLLVRAGVGRVTLIDRDLVERTNLQRQTLFTERDAEDAVPKAEAARSRLAAVNSSVDIRSVVRDATGANIEELLGLPMPLESRRPMVVLDGTDNFETRYLLNDVAVKHGVALVYGGVVGTRGMQMTIQPGASACLRCVFEDPPEPGSSPTCDTAGVLGPVVSIVAGAQAAEAIKILIGRRDLVSRSLLDFDPWEGQRRRLAVERREACPCCGGRDFAFLARRGSDAALCGQDAVQVMPREGVRLDLTQVAGRLAAHGVFSRMGSMLVRGELREERGDVGGPVGLTVFADGRAIVRGTTRAERARSIYARYVGG